MCFCILCCVGVCICLNDNGEDYEAFVVYYKYILLMMMNAEKLKQMQDQVRIGGKVCVIIVFC